MIERRDPVSALLRLRDLLDPCDRRAPVPRGAEPLRALVEDEQVLRGAIETEIIPRLLLAHRAPRREALAVEGAEITAEDRTRLLDTVLAESAASTRRCVEELLQRGIPEETVLLDLLTWCARRLGELWEEDRCDFAEVTIGLCRLHQVLRELGTWGDGGAAPHADAPRVLLATACGDQHVFGVVMVAEFFRREGWRVWSEPGASCAQLCGLLSRESFDVLGLSAARSVVADDVATEIGTLRKASCNTQLKVLIGGRLFAETPELIESVGADGSALDARSAPSAGNLLLAP